MRKRNKLFVDGRLLFYPIVTVIAGILFVRGWLSLIVIAAGVLMYMSARWQFMNFPWFIDDFQSEMSFEYEYHDVGMRGRSAPRARRARKVSR